VHTKGYQQEKEKRLVREEVEKTKELVWCSESSDAVVGVRAQETGLPHLHNLEPAVNKFIRAGAKSQTDMTYA
jgi:hypothetical protein